MILEPQISSNTNNQSSFQTSHLEAIAFDLNLTNASIDIHPTEDIVTSTASTSPIPPTINHNEPLSPSYSGPLVKGIPMNTKTLPELFKLIEKLNFNLTLSNRYLQELSQHYVYVKNAKNFIYNLIFFYLIGKNLMKPNKLLIFF